MGRRAAALLFATLRARWTVRVLEANADALAFWREVMRDLARDATNGSVSEAERREGDRAWPVFQFDSTSGAG